MFSEIIKNKYTENSFNSIDWSDFQKNHTNQIDELNQQIQELTQRLNEHNANQLSNGQTVRQHQQQIEDLKQDNTQLKYALQNKVASNDFEKLKADLEYLKEALLKAEK